MHWILDSHIYLANQISSPWQPTHHIIHSSAPANCKSHLQTTRRTRRDVFIKKFAGEKKCIAARIYKPFGNKSYEVVLEGGWHVKCHLYQSESGLIHQNIKSNYPYGAIHTI